MRKSLLAVMAATIIAGCNLAPFDQKDYKWVDVEGTRPAIYRYYVSDSGVRKVYSALTKDSVWTYYIIGGIMNKDTATIKVSAVYDSVYRPNKEPRSDTGYAGNMPARSTSIDSLIPDPNISVSASNLFVIKGEADWSDSASIIVYVNMHDVQTHSTSLVLAKHSPQSPIKIKFLYKQGKPETEIILPQGKP